MLTEQHHRCRTSWLGRIALLSPITTQEDTPSFTATVAFPPISRLKFPHSYTSDTVPTFTVAAPARQLTSHGQLEIHPTQHLVSTYR